MLGQFVQFECCVMMWALHACPASVLICLSVCLDVPGALFTDRWQTSSCRQAATALSWLQPGQPASQPAGCVACIAYNYITHSMMLFACRRPFIFRQQFHCLFFASHGQTNSFHAECRTTLWTSLTRVFSLIPVILKLMKELKVISLAIMPCCIVCNALLAIVKPSVHRTRDL